MPIAGLGVTGLADLIGMRTALAIASILFGIGAFLVLNAAGRQVCECPDPVIAVPEPEAEPVVIP
jgi:hypothetical protein